MVTQLKQYRRLGGTIWLSGIFFALHAISVLADDASIGDASGGVAANQLDRGVALAAAVEISPLAAIGLDIRQVDPFLPPDRSEDIFTPAGSAVPRTEEWTRRELSWEATEFWHHPLYFDDVLLERYGQTVSPLLQPALSGVHFFGTLPILPYKAGIDRPCDRIATLGYYRAGSPTPTVKRRLPPLEGDAALFEASMWLALVLLLP